MLRIGAAFLAAVVTWGCAPTDSKQAHESATASVPAAAERNPGSQTGALVATAKLPLSGAARKNKHLQLEDEEAGFDPAAPDITFPNTSCFGKPDSLSGFTIRIETCLFKRAASAVAC